MAQLYGQVRTDWNQCFVIDCSLSHPAGHKPFSCSHSVLCNAWLNIHAIRWMRFSARLSVWLGTNHSHVYTGFYATRDSLFMPFVQCVFLLAFLCMYLRSHGTILDLFVSSALSELSSAWSINCFLRYVCCCIIIRYIVKFLTLKLATA